MQVHALPHVSRNALERYRHGCPLPSHHTVSLVNVKLVDLTAIFIAAKCIEIWRRGMFSQPTVTDTADCSASEEEVVLLSENGYTKDGFSRAKAYFKISRMLRLASLHSCTLGKKDQQSRRL